MTADLLVRNVRPRGGAPADVWARDGVIVKVAPAIAAPAGAVVVDGKGGLLLPALVDAHMHLDKTFWGQAADSITFISLGALLTLIAAGIQLVKAFAAVLP